MGPPSSSIVEQHEFLDVVLEPFSFKQKAECHVQESSGKHGWRRFGSGETETDEFGVKEPPERNENISARFECSNSPENQGLGQSYVSSSVRKLVRNSNQDPTAYSQERRQDDTLSSSTRKLVRSGESASSLSTRKLVRKPELQEVNSLMRNPRSDNRTSGNRLRECLQRFDTLVKIFNLREFVCEDARFARRVSIGMSDKTIPDVDDGFGDRAPACREYTLPREDQKFQNLCNDCRTNYNWTTSSSYFSISWHQRNWNSESFHNNEKSNPLGGDMPRDKPLRGRVTSQWSRPQYHKF